MTSVAVINISMYFKIFGCKTFPEIGCCFFIWRVSDYFWTLNYFFYSWKDCVILFVEHRKVPSILLNFTCLSKWLRLNNIYIFIIDGIFIIKNFMVVLVSPAESIYARQISVEFFLLLLFVFFVLLKFLEYFDWLG